jgi:glycosyltransferase involved in cell wall biosynthesis
MSILSLRRSYAVDPDFSVVVPTYNEAFYLESTLQSVRDQDFRGSVELIVVDNNSTDATAQIARDYADLVLYYTDMQGASAARQRGAERSRGKYLAFLDAGTVLSPNLLSEAVCSLQAGYVGGRAPIRIADDSFGARWMEGIANGWHRFVGPTFIPFLYCVREVFVRAGGWDLQCARAEEVRLQQRMRRLGRLAWNARGQTTTDGRRYRDDGRNGPTLKGVLSQFLGVNCALRPTQGLPCVTGGDAEFVHEPRAARTTAASFQRSGPATHAQ